MRGRFLVDVQLRRHMVPSFEVYPFCVPVVRRLETLPLHPHVTFIIGDNGSGKSTLLEAIAIACGFNPEGGSRNIRFSTRESHSVLWKYLTISRSTRRARDGYFLRAESLYNLASEIERIDLISEVDSQNTDSCRGGSLHEQSHGESFLALINKRFGGHGIYILDEPEAALSPMKQMSLISRMHQLVSDDSQFIIATHSPIVMAYPGSVIYIVDGGGLRQIEYTETEHYVVAKSFLNNHEQMLRILLEGD